MMKCKNLLFHNFLTQMKSSRLILGVLSIMTLCLAACGKPNMSFEAAVDNVFHSELNEIMNDE